MIGRNLREPRYHRGGKWLAWITGGCLGLSSFCASVCGLEITRGPYLQSGTPQSVIVRWRTDAAADSAVRYGTNATNLNLSVSAAQARTEHELRLQGLAPYTRYYYSVGTTREPLLEGPGYFFRTAPLGRKPTRIWVLGDSGTADENAQAVRDAYYAYAGTRHTDLWLMLGDNAYYQGTDEQYQRAVFEMYPEMLRKSVLWPTIGNHETYADFPYPDIFSLPVNGEAGGQPSGSERYYSFDFANIHFVCLDSMTQDRAPDAAMGTWLEEDLGSTTNDWLVAFWHHPPYSKGSHDSDSESELIGMRENVLPILERHGVDLVLCGHSHSYERSCMINGHYGYSTSLTADMKKDAGDGRLNGTGAYFKGGIGPETNSGTVYVVAGSSGLTSGGDLNHPVMIVAYNELGSLVLDVDGDQLDARFLQASGTITDNFTMIKGTNNAMRIVAHRFTTNMVTLTWNTLPNRRYQVQHKPALPTPPWTNASGVINAIGTRTSWSGGLPRGQSNGFYRIVDLTE